MLKNYEKPIITVSRELYLTITIMHVFRANFNDTYYLDKVFFNLKIA